jgi:tetratricopeptide (TPR) repeat protein
MSQTSIPTAANLPAQAEPGIQSGEAIKDDFGRLVRRIMYSESGKHKRLQAPEGVLPPSSQKVVLVDNSEWNACHLEAEHAAGEQRWDTAEALWLRALELSNTFNTRDPRLPQTLDSLASLYYVRGQFDKAEAFSLQTLEITKKVYGNMHSKVASCLNNVAGIYFTQNLLKKAEPYCVQILDIYNSLYPQDHPDIGMAHNNLAMLYHAQGKYSLSKVHYEQALPIRKRVLGNDHPSVQKLLDGYLELLQRLGHDDTASSVRQTRQEAVTWKLFDAAITLPSFLV